MVCSARCGSNNPTSSRQGLSGASQRCKISSRIPKALVYDQTASKSGLTLPVHLSLSLLKSAGSFANLSSLFPFLLPLFSFWRPSNDSLQSVFFFFYGMLPFFLIFFFLNQDFAIKATSLQTSSHTSLITSSLLSDHSN